VIKQQPGRAGSQTDFVADTSLARKAVSAPNHAHDLEAFDRGDGSLHGLKASRGPNHPLQCTMICLDDVVQVLRSSVPRLVRYLASRLSWVIASGYEGSLSVVIDVGGQVRIVVTALLKNRCAAPVFRICDTTEDRPG